LAQPFGNCFDGQRAGLRGGDFDRQWDTIELLADTSDRQNIRVGEREIQQRLRGTVCEKLNRVKAQRIRNREMFPIIDCRGGKWFQPYNMLISKAKRGAARRQHRQPCSVIEQSVWTRRAHAFTRCSQLSSTRSMVLSRR
jgi:hypothetical protein